MKGNDTLSCVAVSIRGKVREIGTAHLQDILMKNRYMYEIYPTEQSRQALTVFSFTRELANGLTFPENLSSVLPFQLEPADKMCKAILLIQIVLAAKAVMLSVRRNVLILNRFLL